MSRRTIGVLDYGVGNVTSVRQALHALDYRCRVSRDREVLDATDLLILPGVGAFPTAMDNLRRNDLADYLREQARLDRPIVGLCLGAQLLLDASPEHRLTAGLGLIPGETRPYGEGDWHIGWNTIEVTGNDAMLRGSDGESFYFNHSYVLDVPEEYRLCISRVDRPFVTGIRRGRTVGLQFHPEKSQTAGRVLLRDVIERLCDA